MRGRADCCEVTAGSIAGDVVDNLLLLMNSVFVPFSMAEHSWPDNVRKEFTAQVQELARWRERSLRLRLFLPFGEPKLHSSPHRFWCWSDMSTVVVIHTCRLFYRRSQSFRLKRGAVAIANHSKEFATCENSSRRFRNSWRRRPRWRITPKGRPSCTSRTTTYQTSRFEV